MKYIIWRDNTPISTGVNEDIRLVGEWIYDKILNITSDEILAIETSSWVEIASIGEEYYMPEYNLKLTITNVD